MSLPDYEKQNFKRFFKGHITTRMALPIKIIMRSFIRALKYNQAGFQNFVNKFLNSEEERELLSTEAKALRCKYRGSSERGLVVEDSSKFSYLTSMTD